MTPEHWQHIKEIFYGALERPPDDRESFIQSACGEDEETRRGVLQLISAHEETGEFLAVPAFDVAAKSLAHSHHENLTQGESIRHYTVLRAIGTGGMGEVYLAEDTRLGRKVAIKLLRSSVSTRSDRLRRFEREARAASALNHPNLCTIYEVGEMDDGRPYIVMEYIEGMTLRQRMSQGRQLLSEVLDIAMQVGSALTAAHQAGIVHRDVKPENITLRPDGIVKVLDFGLAKLTEQRRDTDSAMPTQIRTQTETGMIMGTARYMSPEQARGYPVDARTDIWSLGVVIYEMTAGQVPFDGATNTDVVVSVLEREPALLMDQLPQVPAELDRIVTKTLRKNREERYRTIRDLCEDLKNLARELELKGTTPSATEFEGAQTIKLDRITKGEGGLRGVLHTGPGQANFTSPLTGAARPYQRLVTLALIGVALVTILMFTFWSPSALRKILQNRPDTTSMSASSVRVVPFTSFIGREDHAAFSPDGNQVAFVWDGEKHDNPDIYVKSLSGERPLRITSDPAIDILPVWSPDGQRIAFVRIAHPQFNIYTVSSLGNGAERKLLTLSRHPGKISWSPDGKFLAVSDKDPGQTVASIFLFSPDTGEKHRLTLPPANIVGDLCPSFSPDGQSVAFIRATSDLTADLYVMRAAGGEAKQLTTDNRLRFAYDQGVIGGVAWSADSQTIIFTSEAGGSPSLWKISMFGGTPERLSIGGVDVFYPTIASNRLAFTQIHGGTPVYQIEGPSSTHPSSDAIRLIASTRSNHTPQFSPDGESIVFESDRSGTHEIWICHRDGTSPTQLTNFGGPYAGSPRWSPDGKQIVFDVHASNIGHIYIVSAEGGPPRRVTSETVDEGLPTWSRDGKWIYFCSNHSGNEQLWKVRAEGGAALQVTKHGGATSFESADGKFLYYSKGPRGVWRVPVDGGEETLILDIPNAGGWGAWTVVDDGIYFINTAVKGTTAIDFFSFATRGVKRITVMQDVNEFVSGLEVSPDGQRILYTQQDNLAGDIMLAENFR
jgi:Tol biopolymer transport system component/serine/threonine protein kinase